MNSAIMIHAPGKTCTNQTPDWTYVNKPFATLVPHYGTPFPSTLRMLRPSKYLNESWNHIYYLLRCSHFKWPCSTSFKLNNCIDITVAVQKIHRVLHKEEILFFPFCCPWSTYVQEQEFLAATKQLYEWYFLYACLSLCLSVCPSVTPFWLCSHHRIIMKFSGVVTKDQGKVHAKGQGQRSKVTEVTTQLNRFRTVTPVWIHIWWWNDTYSLMLLRRGALMFFKIIRPISRSHGAKNHRIWPRLGVSGL